MQRLDQGADGFVATLEDGSEIVAGAVVLAMGMDPHRRLPAELLDLLPFGSWQHTCDAVDPAGAAGRRYLVVGGRQSAFEWAALLTEAGAESVDLVHRHASPAFATADWSWVTAVVDRMVGDPGWFSRLASGGAAGLPAAVVGRRPAQGRAVAPGPAPVGPGAGARRDPRDELRPVTRRGSAGAAG